MASGLAVYGALAPDDVLLSMDLKNGRRGGEEHGRGAGHRQASVALGAHAGN
jgi:hypothetical protein